MATDEYRVKTSEVLVENSHSILHTSSVGSCIVIVLYDEAKGVGGIAHSMLSDRRDDDCSTGGRYVDCGVSILIEEIEKKGGKLNNLKAKLIGGASMFTIFNKNKIGDDNINKAKEELQKHNIEIIAEDIGGQHGRTVKFDLGDFSVTVKSVLGVKQI